MMLWHIGEDHAAAMIELALHTLFAARTARTRDLGGTATTEEFTDALCRAIDAAATRAVPSV